MSRIIFCDWDGVIKINGVFSKSAMNNLNIILNSHKDNKIVVSSSWRHKGLKFCKDTLENNGIDPDQVVGVTDPTHMDSRGHHITRYLQDHKNVKGYVILDDVDEFNGIESHLVLVNSYIGLTGSDVKKSIDILKKPV